MATFLMFGRYSSEALRGMSSKRTEEARSLIKKFGGDVKAMYSLLGEKDLVIILTFPGIEEAMKASVALSKLTGISFTTSPAVTVEEFDKLMTEV
ncbi:MAG: GYD domain-containing protein [Planctomycetota bacterium]